MKMRGCSVLFVCALCVFVMCGAAAVVVAHDGNLTPEMRAVRDAKAIADAVKQKGNEALGFYSEFQSNVTTAAGYLEEAIKVVTDSKTTAEQIHLSNKPTREDILENIGELERKVAKAKSEVEKLKDADLATFINPDEKKKFTNKMTEVENKMTEMETAAAAVTDDILSIKDVITKAGALETAARKASGLWYVALNELKAQLDKVKAAVDAVKTAITETETAVKRFVTNPDLYAALAKDDLSKYVKTKLESSLVKVQELQTASQNSKDAAGEAKEVYNKLAGEAKKVKQAAEERRRRVQNPLLATLPPSALPATSTPQKTYDFWSGSFCSLVLPILFFFAGVCSLAFGHPSPSGEPSGKKNKNKI